MGSPTTETLNRLANDAGWHLFELDSKTDSARLLALSEARYSKASFLDQRLLADDGQSSPRLETVSIPQLQAALADRMQPVPHFIFHIGHCGSTLLSRALAAAPAVLPLREPLTLRQLAACQADAANDDWQQQLELVLHAHSRTFHAGQFSMIKATSTCNALIQPILQVSPLSRALLIYVPLESFLAGMLGKQTPPLDLRGHTTIRLQDWNRLAGTPIPPEQVASFGDSQLAVLAWMTSMSHLLQAHSASPENCLLLDFEVFLREAEASLEQLLEFFGLDSAKDTVIQAWPDISLAYSKKPDEPYSAFNRNRTLSRGRLMRGAEIQAGLDWAGQLLQQHPVLDLCRPYFGLRA